MKILILILLLIPSRVRTVDKAEYSRYLAYCNEIVSKHVVQNGKITLLKVNGQYVDSLGNYKASTREPYWYKLGTKSLTAQPNEAFIQRRIKIQEKRKTPSVMDFYVNWLVPKYQAEIKRIEEELQSGRMSDENAELLKLDLAAVKLKLSAIQ